MRNFVKYLALPTLLLPSLLWLTLPSLLSASPFLPAYTSPGDISIGAEWIYFAPTSETDYLGLATDEEINTSGTIQANRFDDYYSGYRVGAHYTFCTEECHRYLSLQWTSLKAAHTLNASTAFGFITPFNVSGPTLTSSKKFTYYAFEAVVGQSVICNNCIDIDLFAGVHYAHFFSRTSLFSPNEALTPAESLNVTLQSSVWGMGPEVGIHTLTPLPCSFSFIADAAAAFLIGTPSFNQRVFTSTTALSTVTLGNQNRCIPYANLRLALNYTFCAPHWNSFCFPRGVKGNIQVGYEGLAYFNTPNPPTVTPIQTTTTLHGPFAGANFIF